MLVLPDEHAQAAAELCQLQHQQQQLVEAGAKGTQEALLDDGGSVASIVRLVATVLRYLHLRSEEQASGPFDPSGAHETFAMVYPPLVATRMRALASRLLAHAVSAGWPAMTALLLPALTPTAPVAQRRCGSSIFWRSPACCVWRLCRGMPPRLRCCWAGPAQPSGWRRRRWRQLAARTRLSRCSCCCWRLPWAAGSRQTWCTCWQVSAYWCVGWVT